MISATLLLKIPKNWIAEISQDYNATVKLLRRVPHKKEGIKDLVEIIADEEKLQEIIESIKKNPYVEKAELKIDEKRIIGSISTYRCVACRSLANSECFLLSAVSKKDKIQWTIATEDKDAISELIELLKKSKCEVEITKYGETDLQDKLTARQEDIIRTAYEEGYFDYPKKIGIRGLAKRFSISTATISEILRKGQKKVLAEYFKDKK